MIAERHCWWCGFAAEVDTENPEPHNGLVRDTETSWICTDNNGCSRRALEGRFAQRDSTANSQNRQED